MVFIMAKFQNRYRIESHRKLDWNYADAGDYYITICIEDMQCILGCVVDAKMVLNDFGKIVQSELIKSADIREELQLGEFVVMPNHIHVIIILNDMGNNANAAHIAHTAETHGRASVSGQMPYRRPQSISSFVAGFKSAVVSAVDDFIDEQALDIPKYNRRNKFWQSNYHDHIIRNQPEYYRIAKYIGDNPQKWERDKNL
tara:strand:- start:9757 stop:10356 length:600 start_codon:yes stop_codon:yes gene_type:complete